MPVLLDKTEDYVLPNLLTTDVVMNTVVSPKSPYRTRKASYDDCREAIKDFKFKSMTEYNAWLETSNCQDIFYKYPAQSYLGKGWVSTRHFLSMSDTEYHQLKVERGRMVGNAHKKSTKKTSVAKTESKAPVAPKQNAENQPSFSQVIHTLCKQGVPDHIVKVVFDSYKPSFQDLKQLCTELIALKTK